MKRMKKFLALAVSVVMGISLIGCGSTTVSDKPTGTTEEKASGDSYTVYCIAPDSGSAWTRFNQGLQDKCEELGWTGNLLAPSTPYDPVEMNELCTTAVNAGADVIMIFTADTELFKDTIEDAKEKGVLMISIAKPNEYCDLRVGTDDKAFGENVAKALVDKMDGKQINVIEMMSDVTSQGQMNQITPFEEKLKELAPDAVIVDRIDCNYNTATAADNMSASYNAHPEANCVISIDGDGAVGCCTFVSEYNLTDSFVVIGVDDDASILQCMLDGTMACSVVNQWYEYGRQATQDAYKILVEGETLEFNQGVDSLILQPEEVEEYAKENNIVMD